MGGPGVEVRPFPVLLPSDLLVEDFSSPGVRAEYMRHVDDPRHWFPGFLAHPIVREVGVGGVAL